MSDERELGPINVSMGDGNAVGHIGHVVNEAPSPELKPLADWSWTNNPDGTVTASLMTEVLAPYPPGNLSLRVNGQTVLSVELRPQRTGIVMTGHTGSRDGHAFTNLQAPYGRVLVVVRARQKEPISIDYFFD